MKNLKATLNIYVFYPLKNKFLQFICAIILIIIFSYLIGRIIHIIFIPHTIYTMINSLLFGLFISVYTIELYQIKKFKFDIIAQYLRPLLIILDEINCQHFTNKYNYHFKQVYNNEEKQVILGVSEHIKLEFNDISSFLNFIQSKKSKNTQFTVTDIDKLYRIIDTQLNFINNFLFNNMGHLIDNMKYFGNHELFINKLEYIKYELNNKYANDHFILEKEYFNYLKTVLSDINRYQKDFNIFNHKLSISIKVDNYYYHEEKTKNIIKDYLNYKGKISDSTFIQYSQNKFT